MRYSRNRKVVIFAIKLAAEFSSAQYKPTDWYSMSQTVRAKGDKDGMQKCRRNERNGILKVLKCAQHVQVNLKSFKS